MRIFVCIKQVPDTETRIKINTSADNIEENGIKWIINPYDEFAIEEAIRFKEKFSDARVTAITVGPKSRVNNALLTAMAMGVDDSIIVDNDSTLDALTTAKLIAGAIKKEENAHLVYSGKLSIDGSSSAVSQMVAELLDMPHVSVATDCSYEPDNLKVKREVEGGTLETFEVKYPALIAANKGLNKPRFASLPGIMKAKKKPVVTMTPEDLGVDTNSVKVRYGQMELPQDRPDCVMLGGDAAEQVTTLVSKLREEAKVI